MADIKKDPNRTCRFEKYTEWDEWQMRCWRREDQKRLKMQWWKHFQIHPRVGNDWEKKTGSISDLWGNIRQYQKAMAPHSSTLAWKIPWTEEPGRLQSRRSLRVGHHWATSRSLFSIMHWRRKWQPTLVLLPGESQGWGSLVGGRLWGRTESDTTEAT